MLEAQLKIYGKVQGVFYRAEAAEQAMKLQLAGWIKNEHDGTVHCLIQGNKANISTFIEWCKNGPKLAEVRAVDVNWNETPENSYKDFSIYRI